MVVAACVAVFAGPLSRAFTLPVGVLLGIAAATAVWACSLWLAAGVVRVRPHLQVVLVANTVAAVLIAVTALIRPADMLSLLLAAVAVEVAGFAVWQIVALRSLA